MTDPTARNDLLCFDQEDPKLSHTVEPAPHSKSPPIPRASRVVSPQCVLHAEYL